MLTFHIKLVHLDKLLEERAMRMNSIQAKYADENMKKFQQLASAGLTTVLISKPYFLAKSKSLWSCAGQPNTAPRP